MKSLAQQDWGKLGGSWSILSRQKRDHIKLDELLHRLEERAPEAQGPVLLAIYRLVFPHAFAEEAVLWPVLRRVLPDGHELTLRVEIEHQEINELIARLEFLDHASVERQQVLARAVELLQEDVRDEEDLLLPRLQLELTKTQLRLLGIAWEAVRAIAPTRAHPIVARRPPGNILSALPLALLDRIRDGVDGWIHSGPSPAAKPLRNLSAALARASHAVERIPGLGRGEDPATRTGRGRRGGRGAAAIFLCAAVSTAILAGRRSGRLPKAI